MHCFMVCKGDCMYKHSGLGNQSLQYNNNNNKQQQQQQTTNTIYMSHAELHAGSNYDRISI